MVYSKLEFRRGFTSISIILVLIVLIAIGGGLGYLYYLIYLPRMVVQKPTANLTTGQETPSKKTTKTKEPTSSILENRTPFFSNTPYINISFYELNDDAQRVFDIHAYTDADTADKKFHTGVVRHPVFGDITEEQIPNSQFNLYSGNWHLILDTGYEYDIELIGKADGYLVMEFKDTNNRPPTLIYPSVLANEQLEVSDPSTLLPKITSAFRAKMTIPRHFIEPPVLYIDFDGDSEFETQLEAGTCLDGNCY